MRPDTGNNNQPQLAQVRTTRAPYVSIQGIPPEKRQASEALRLEIERFLAAGGKIIRVPPGASSKPIKLNKKQKNSFNAREPQESE